MMVTMAILGIVSGPILAIFYQSEASFQAQNQQAVVLQHMRLAMDQISRVIRQAGNEPVAAIGVPPVTVLGEGEIRVCSDITGSVASTTGNPAESTGDPDGLLNSVYEIVEFRHDDASNSILADIGYGEGILAEGISELNFTAFDLNGNPTADPNNIVRIQVEMTGTTRDPDMQIGRRYTLTLRSDVFIRSRMPQVMPEGDES